MHPEDAGRYTLHDLQADVVAHQLGPDGLTEAHAQLLAGCLPPAPWTGPRCPTTATCSTTSLTTWRGLGAARRCATCSATSWLYTQLQSVGLVSVLADYAHLPDDPAAQTLQIALRLSAHALADDPAQLPGQLIGRLQDDHDSALEGLLDQAARWSQEAWLCRPPARSPRRTDRSTHPTQRPGPGGGGHRGRPGRLRRYGRTVRVWKLDSDREPLCLEGHSGAVNAVAVTDDGRRVVSAGGDATVRVWDLDGGRKPLCLDGHSGAVNAVAVTDDGRRVVSAGGDATVRVWDLDGRRKRLSSRATPARLWRWRSPTTAGSSPPVTTRRCASGSSIAGASCSASRATPAG